MRLRLISEDRARPRIISSDSTGTVRIAFPDGSIYEYVTYDAYRVGQLRRQYGRNMGRFVQELDNFTRQSGGQVNQIQGPAVQPDPPPDAAEPPPTDPGTPTT